jgi:hypothetical protein
VSIDLETLYTVSGSVVIEKLGKVQEGERIKVEFRGQTAADSPIAGKAHGASWVLIGATGPGETSAVAELVSPERERLVLEGRGYARELAGTLMEIRLTGIIRSSAPRFAALDGRVAVWVQSVGPGEHTTIRAYCW